MVLFLSYLEVLIPIVFSTLSLAVPAATPGPGDVLAQIALNNVYKVLNGTLSGGSTHASCTKDKLTVRKE